MPENIDLRDRAINLPLTPSLTIVGPKQTAVKIIVAVVDVVGNHQTEIILPAGHLVDAISSLAVEKLTKKQNIITYR